MNVLTNVDFDNMRKIYKFDDFYFGTTDYVELLVGGEFSIHWESLLSENELNDISNKISSIIPTLKYSEVKEKCIYLENSDEYIYGEYPQTVVEEEYQSELEKLYLQNRLSKTNRVYTINVGMDIFVPYQIDEYVYNDEKYVRVYAKHNIKESDYFDELSDGRVFIEGDVFWVKVEPVKWILDVENDKLLAKYNLIGNIQYKDIEYYINKYLSKELIGQSIQTEKNDSKELSDQELYSELSYVIDTLKVLKQLELSDEFKHELLALIVWICNKNKRAAHYEDECIINMPNIVMGYRLLTDMFLNIPEYYDDIDIKDYISKYLKNTEFIDFDIKWDLITKIRYIIDKLYPEERIVYKLK